MKAYPMARGAGPATRRLPRTLPERFGRPRQRHTSCPTGDRFAGGTDEAVLIAAWAAACDTTSCSITTTRSAARRSWRVTCAGWFVVRAIAKTFDRYLQPSQGVDLAARMA